jgi:hypothetical protein
MHMHVRALDSQVLEYLIDRVVAHIN